MIELALPPVYDNQYSTIPLAPIHNVRLIDRFYYLFFHAHNLVRINPNDRYALATLASLLRRNLDTYRYNRAIFYVITEHLAFDRNILLVGSNRDNYMEITHL